MCTGFRQPDTRIRTNPSGKVCLLAILLLLPPVPDRIQASVPDKEEVAFPVDRPRDGNFNRPLEGELLDVSPPGFCWWRAGARGEIHYRVRIFNGEHAEIHTSGRLEDPAYVPAQVFPAGDYTWKVEAVDAHDRVLAVREEWAFKISPHAAALPWIDPPELLARVPPAHPRLLFPGEQLEAVRENLGGIYREPYADLIRTAGRAMDMPLLSRPVFDTLTGRKNYAARRTVYREEYHSVGDTYIGGVVPLALAYLLSGEEKYGQAARSHLLNLCSWELGGALSVEDPRFDEIGLRLARALPEAYDWTCSLFSGEEQKRMEDWMAALGDSLLLRMKTRDFLFYSGESHDGRIPGYLMEFAIALAHRPEAEAWMEFGMRAALTVFPHWAGSGGGWAEGVDYALQYNERFITPLHAVLAATGYNLWKKPFFSKFPYFLTYCISPLGEITPFGDSENQPAAMRAGKLNGMLHYYASINGDSGLRWWTDLFPYRPADSTGEGYSALVSFLYPDTLIPSIPSSLPNDRAFPGVGWTALHSDITDPDKDLLLLFKSSPFGAASHSHADQNSFAILKGGKALATPAGERYPQHGSPFHTRYTRLTEAHNALLFNGKGQRDKETGANGSIVDFRSTPHLGYAAGDARDAYGPPVRKFIRHVLLVRPSLVLVVDDVETESPGSIDWLIHGKERFDLFPEEQKLTSHRSGARMQIELLSREGFEFSQSDEWPVDPKEGYPMVKTESPAKQWHFRGRLEQAGTETILAAIMQISEGAGGVRLETMRRDKGREVLARASFDDGSRVTARIRLAPGIQGKSAGKAALPLLRVSYFPAGGRKEKLIINMGNLNQNKSL